MVYQVEFTQELEPRLDSQNPLNGLQNVFANLS